MLSIVDILGDGLAHLLNLVNQLVLMILLSSGKVDSRCIIWSLLGYTVIDCLQDICFGAFSLS